MVVSTGSGLTHDTGVQEKFSTKSKAGPVLRKLKKTDKPIELKTLIETPTLQVVDADKKENITKNVSAAEFLNTSKGTALINNSI